MAQSLLQESVTLFREIGDRWSMVRAWKDLGETALQLGDMAQARQHLRSVLETALEIELLPVALDALLGLAQVQVVAGNSQRALELALLVLNHPASSQPARDQAKRLQAEMEAQFSPPQIETIWAQARTFEAVIEEILKEIS